MSRRKKLEENQTDSNLSKEDIEFWNSRKDVHNEVKLKKAKDLKRTEKWKEEYSKAKAKHNS